MTEISVNHVQVNSVLLRNKKVAVGGTLQLDENRLDFVPTKWDEITGGDRVSIRVEKIDTVGKKERYTGGVFDTLFAGGLRDRLRVQRTDGTEELFVVSNLDEVIGELNELLE